MLVNDVLSNQHLKNMSPPCSDDNSQSWRKLREDFGQTAFAPLPTGLTTMSEFFQIVPEANMNIIRSHASPFGSRPNEYAC
jgi:hypothetical protein